jgi:hypothetical protein
MSNKKTTTQPAAKQGRPPVQPPESPISVFDTVCALETLATFLEDSAGLDDADALGVARLQRLMAQTLRATYDDLKTPPAAA